MMLESLENQDKFTNLLTSRQANTAPKETEFSEQINACFDAGLMDGISTLRTLCNDKSVSAEIRVTCAIALINIRMQECD